MIGKAGGWTQNGWPPPTRVVNQDGELATAPGWRFIHVATVVPWVHAAILCPARSQVNLIFAGPRQKPAGAKNT
jgi:hypothetical protein